MRITQPILVDDRDCAFAKTIQLPDGRVLCSYGVGGGPEVWGGSEWSWSPDGGRSWRLGGGILCRRIEGDTVISNALKLSRSPDGGTLYAYGSRFHRRGSARFGCGRDEAVLCQSTDGGASWSPPEVVPFGCGHPIEVSDAALVLPDGRLLAPAGLLPAEDRLGERVLVLGSDDGGRTWPIRAVVFEHPEHQHGYFEHKFCLLPDGAILAICWTVSLDRELVDQPNHWALSRDRGETWTRPESTGIRGQTMCPLALDGNRLLLAYNRRHGEQGIVLAVVRLDRDWEVESETLSYAAGGQSALAEVAIGVDSFDAFQFGFPSLLRLADGAVLLTYWARPVGAERFGIYAVRIEVA